MSLQKSLRAHGEPATKLPLDRLLAEAIERGAGMVHIEPEATRAAVRVRADLQLQRFQNITREDYFVLWQNIADRFGAVRPEPFFEGSFPFQHDGLAWLIRVSMVPTPHGDSIALKINNRETKVLPLDRLGLADHDLARLRAVLSRTRGLVLVAGPSGSGGTTTLLSALSSLADGVRKILSIEDPIEVHLEGVQQIQVKVMREYPERSVTFARALRATAMQNPDVIAIGKLRDAETANTAMQAALSGALVLSRLHAPGAALAITRLQALGGDRHLLADCLRAVVAQALLRRNCPDCVAPLETEPAGLDAEPAADRAALVAAARQGRGCPACHGTGARGVLPVFELMPVEGEIARAVAANATASAIQDLRTRDGHESLEQAARRHVLTGAVPLSEYLKLL